MGLWPEKKTPIWEETFSTSGLQRAYDLSNLQSHQAIGSGACLAVISSLCPLSQTVKLFLLDGQGGGGGRDQTSGCYIV